MTAVANEFGLHALAVEDAVSAHQRPKLERYDDNLFTVLRPDLLQHGLEAVLSALLDRVVDDYAPVVAGLENDIDEIEDHLFSGDSSVSRRICELAPEVIRFQRAIHPLPDMLDQLKRGFEKYQVELTCGTACATWKIMLSGQSPG